ncbi:3-hydroxyisobutyrate dehydrogenase [Pseudomonas sp. IT-194MI4]|uniref:Dehydrogenase n=2 Tax=Pseudomonas TaxID=286 RepID=A0A1H0UP92_PSERE|nr:MULTISPECIES: NAD(P)-dependent oxidoreductase [Pseudomonas]NBB61788.1 NAD-binding protein [Pseudomonas sp. ODNR1LW]KAB0488396.1 NAD(P)-dependent oxidoreductase [Pseudomonas reinekei]KAB0509959.1 NAD(P)-dependent oxidoreductase [Pseudomonas moorei]OLU05882.1 dehydrogenase [Pseudomonas reinekei]SDP67954.1 3-hydroxyisobutyrate dehydrogenase [Pseudomonas reinekei]
MSAITIGMVGIGQLGLPIASNLLAAGYRVVGYRRRDREPFVQLGGIALNSPAEVAAESDFILTCLPSEASQIEIMEGPDGLLGALRPDHTLIEMGTYERDFKVQMAERIQGKGARVLEAEVSGSPPLVLARKASLFLGGDEQLIEHCQPVLSAIADIQFRIGEFGSAVAMKLIANYLLTIHTLAAAEAMNLGVRAGFSAEKVVEVIRQSAGSSTMFMVRAPMMASRTFQPAPGPIVTLEKYLHMAGDLSADLGCASPLFSAAQSYFNRALDLGMGEEDISAVIKLIEADSRVRPQQE